LHSCLLAIWFQRTNNRSRNIDQSYPSLLLLTLDSSLLPHTAAAAVYVPRSATYLLFRYFLPFKKLKLGLFLPFLTDRKRMAEARIGGEWMAVAPGLAVAVVL
jgi:hypothetical protein